MRHFLNATGCRISGFVTASSARVASIRRTRSGHVELVHHPSMVLRLFGPRPVAKSKDALVSCGWDDADCGVVLVGADSESVSLDRHRMSVLAA